MALVQPDEFYFTAVGKTTQSVNTGGGIATDSGHRLICIQTSGNTANDLVVADSPFDGARVIRPPQTSGSNALYLTGVAAGSAGPPGTTPFSAFPVTYQGFYYRQLSYSTFTGDLEANGSATLGITYNSTDANTADSGNHIKMYRDKIAVTTLTNPGSVETAVTSWSGITPNPGNGWRLVEFAIDRTLGRCVIRDWNGTETNYSAALLIDNTAQYPIFEWYITNFATLQAVEIQKMWASTTEGMDADRRSYYNQMFTDAGLSVPTGPTFVTPGNPVFFDLSVLPNDTTANALGSNFVQPNAGSSRFIAVTSGRGYGNFPDNYGNVAYRKDYLFTNDNHRCTMTGANFWVFQPIVRADGSGKCAMGWGANSNRWQLWNCTDTTWGVTGATNVQSGNVPTGVVGAKWALGVSGRWFIEYYQGVAANVFLDSSNVMRTTGKKLAVGMMTTNNTYGFTGVLWEDLGPGGLLASKGIKSGTQAWQTAASWVAVGPWTPQQIATSNAPTYTTQMDGAAQLTGTGNAIKVIGSGLAKLSASIPYTGSTAGRTHQIRITRTKLANGTADATVVATGTNVTTASGTATVTGTFTVTSEEVYQVEMLGSGTSAGTITATTPTFTIEPVMAGTASGTYTWAGTGTGKRVPKGSNTAATYTWAGTGTGKRTPKASGSAGYAWACTGTGYRLPKGTSAPTYTWAGSAVGQTPIPPVRTGAGSGTYTWAATATGKQVPKGTGAATYTWACTATGKRTPKGSSSPTYTWACSQTGKRTPKASNNSAYTWAGSGTGKFAPFGTSSPLYTWASSVAGKTSFRGATAGNYTWASNAAGKASVGGSAAGTYTWACTATSKRTPKANSLGNYTWAGAATGVRPTVAAANGTASATYTWVCTGTGKRTPKGSSAPTYNFSGASTVGTTSRAGTTEGTYDWDGSAVGTAPPVGAKTGAAGGTYTWAATATSRRTPKAAGTGEYMWAADATGAAPVIPPGAGTASATYTWVCTGTGKRTPKGTGGGTTYGWGATTTGKRVPVGAGSGMYGSWTGVPVGQRATTSGAASGTYSWGAAGAVGSKKRAGAAVGGTYRWGGSAHGIAIYYRSGTAIPSSWGWATHAAGTDLSYKPPPVPGDGYVSTGRRKAQLGDGRVQQFLEAESVAQARPGPPLGDIEGAPWAAFARREFDE